MPSGRFSNGLFERGGVWKGRGVWADPGVLWKKGSQSNESYEKENPWNRTISTVLWMHKELPQNTVKLVLPSNESYESKTGCNRTLATVLWVLEYGWLMPEGSPHDSPLCPESLKNLISICWIDLALGSQWGIIPERMIPIGLCTGIFWLNILGSRAPQPLKSKKGAAALYWTLPTCSRQSVGSSPSLCLLAWRNLPFAPSEDSWEEIALSSEKLICHPEPVRGSVSWLACLRDI